MLGCDAVAAPTGLIAAATPLMVSRRRFSCRSASGTKEEKADRIANLRQRHDHAGTLRGQPYRGRNQLR